MKKKHRTQKQRALRLGVWVVVLALAVVLSGIYTPLPQTLIRNAEVTRSCGETQLIRKETLNHRPHYLTANQNALLLTVGEFHPLLGWQQCTRSQLDLSQEDSLSVEILATEPRMIRDPDKDILAIHYFGTAPKEAASVLIRFPWVEDAEPKEIPTFLGEDGQTYFWDWLTFPISARDEDSTYGHSKPLLVEALDQDGQVIATCMHPRYYDGSPLT
ncbi:MAG: hypothetical protein IJO69_07385 [Ruminiclostridium sp.]|nr:hypothetical protein [Ruminiclostridium sp.]